MVKAKFTAAREIMIEFVFSLCENGFVPGSATAPHRTDSIIRLTRGRPGEHFFVRAGLAIAEDAQKCVSRIRHAFAAARCRRHFGVRWEAQRHTALLSSAFAGIANHFTLCALGDDTGAKKAPSPLRFAGAVQNEEAPLALNTDGSLPPKFGRNLTNESGVLVCVLASRAASVSF